MGQVAAKSMSSLLDRATVECSAVTLYILVGGTRYQVLRKPKLSGVYVDAGIFYYLPKRQSIRVKNKRYKCAKYTDLPVV
jgi:hypothetical protein